MSVLWFQKALLPDGWAEDVRIEVEGGLITRVERRTTPGPGDERGGIAVPGLPNVHSHGFQRAMAGLTEQRGASDDSFWTWRKLMYRFLDRLTPEDVQAITSLAYSEMLEAGFTRVGEFHYLHHDRSGASYANVAEMAERIVAAAEATGIGLTLLPVYYAHGDFGGAPPEPAQRRFVNDPDTFARLHEACRAALTPLADGLAGLAPHSLRAVTPAELQLIIPICTRGPLHIHAAEQLGEVEACVAWSGRRPVEWLLDHAGVDQRWCLVHATHATSDELTRLAASGAVAGLCPITEADLGDGLFNAETYLGAGGAFGVGSDSNLKIDASAELGLLEFGQRLAARRRNRLATTEQPSTGGRLFVGALSGGFRALGASSGGLEVNSPADIVELDASHPSLIARSGDVILDSWIFAGSPAAVRTVWRRGKRVVEEGRHRSQQAIRENYRRTLEKLMAE